MSIPLPLPNDKFRDKVVVASTWLNDDDDTLTALLLLLHQESPFYVIANIQIVEGHWQVTSEFARSSVNDAVADFADEGGDD